MPCPSVVDADDAVKNVDFEEMRFCLLNTSVFGGRSAISALIAKLKSLP